MTDQPAPSGGVLRHDETTGRVRYAVTGGIDLGDGAPDGPAARAALARELGVEPDRLLLPTQVHGADVLVVDGPWAGDVPQADGLVVTVPGAAAGVRAADCMPLLLGDGERGLAAAVHVGRAGLQGGIVGVAVDALARLGATSLLARLGPTVCGSCYEVPEQMRDEVAALVPAAAGTTRDGTPSVDIPAGVRVQLAAAASAAGVQVEIDDSWGGCTMEDPLSFSHRRDAPTGRHAGVVVVLP
ncbi:polyphenol oxidase family protein [Aquipuribacter hungaricus]|uniref:Polyphenol oxidase family protein n=1 Tax=Aquipuribacter hungaricus TaxID=545624 RepID=A0ABV7WKC3_9MICO